MPTLANASLSVEIAARGAELRSLRTADGAEWLWQGDPQWWTGRAPLLFPIVGPAPGGAVSAGGTRSPMKQHGVARISDFAEVEASVNRVRMQLLANDETRAAYPFDFALTVAYQLADDGALTVDATVENRDDRPMPFQFGFHPAFAWPLPGAAGAGHAVSFPEAGALVLRRLGADGLLAPGSQPAPLDGGRILPEAAMFEDGAMIFPEGAGSRVRFAADTGRAVEMETRNLPNFALWQKPGAPYLCLEPWHGFNPPPEAGDELEDRPFALTVAPGASRSFGMTLRFLR